MKNDKIKLKIIDLEKTLFDDNVLAVTTYNTFGIFDILPMHSNFITLISKKIIITTVNGKKEEIEFKSGVLRNIDSLVEIYLGI